MNRSYINKRLFLIVQMATIMDSLAAEVEGELKRSDIWQHNIKHNLKQIRSLIGRLYDSEPFKRFSIEQLGAFGEGGEAIERLLMGMLDGTIKHVEFEEKEE